MQLRMKSIAAIAAVLLMTGSAFAEGAIAVDDEAGSKPGDAGYGVGYGDTKDGAKAAALKKCQASGNDSCKVVVWFKKCGAYASSKEKFGIGYGDSESVAKSTAMEQCGNANCKIVVSDCDED